MISNTIKLATCFAVLAILPACSTTSKEPEIAMMPVSECHEAKWKAEAEKWKEKAMMASEKSQRIEEDYNESFRK